MDSLTRAGIQFAGEIDDKTEAVVQVLGRAEEDFDAGLQLAYVSHEFSPALTARAGRLVLPLYMHSQYTQVGYAYNWVTLPEEMYSVIPLDIHVGSICSGKYRQDLSQIPSTYSGAGWMSLPTDCSFMEGNNNNKVVN